MDLKKGVNPCELKHIYLTIWNTVTLLLCPKQITRCYSGRLTNNHLACATLCFSLKKMVHYWLHELSAVLCDLGVRTCSLLSIIASTTELLKKNCIMKIIKSYKVKTKYLYIFILKKIANFFYNSVAILHVFQKKFLTFMFSPMPSLVQGLPSQK